jgi:hypothetical protein
MAKSNKRPLAVFPMRTLGRIADFIIYLRTVVLNIGNNLGFFPTPSPTLASVTTHVDDLEAAESVAQTHVTGSAAARDLKYDIVLDDLHGLQGYVQKVADNSADEPTAIAIINASGFGLKVRGIRVKPDLKLEYGDVSGTVKLIAKSAGARSSYQWQTSADGLAWTDLPPSLQAKTSVTRLSPGTRISFRYKAITKDGPGDWSNSVSIIVL